MNSNNILRYGATIMALFMGLAISIRLGERGFLLDAGAGEAVASAPREGEQWNLEGLTVLNRVLLQMRDNYVEPNRIDPARMLVYALDGVQASIPEVVALFNRSIADSPTEVELHVGTASQTFSLTEVDSLWSMSFRLREIFRFIQEQVDTNEIDLQEVEYAAINGALRTLDPHSVLLNPKVFAEMQAANRGSFGGVGIMISLRNGSLTVVSPIHNTPASRAGLKAGDVIVTINDESTINMPLDEAVSRLRGPPNTDVVVEIVRENQPEPQSYTLRREMIVIESIRSHALGGGIGYIEVRNFQRNTHRDMLAALRTLRTEMGELNGLVLDLRNNPGGLLEQAVRISDTFLSEGNIVTTVGVGDRLREEKPARAENTEPEYPIVVLVNGGSASASEIVAGALRNHDRALLVGSQTFGKGSVQFLYEFGDGSALKLTIAQYLIPGDISIQGVGITPDIAVMPMSMSEDRINLYPNQRQRRESDVSTRLDTLTSGDGQQARVERPALVLRYLDDTPEQDPDAFIDDDAFNPDFEIRFARDILNSAGEVWQREALLGRARAAVQEADSQQQRAVAEQLRGQNIDWSTGETVVQPLDVEISTNRADAIVYAGESMELTASVTNRGSRPLYRVRGITDSDFRLFDNHELVFGRLDPGETRTWSVTVRVPEEELSRRDNVNFSFFSDEIDLESSADLFVHVKGNERPAWGFTYDLDVLNQPSNLLYPDSRANITITVTNQGSGTSESSLVSLRNRSEAALFLRSGREEIPALAPGQSTSVTFEFDVREIPESGAAELTIEVYDMTYREYLSEEFEIPVNDAPTELERRTGGFVPASDTSVLAFPSESAPTVGLISAMDELAVSGAVGDYVRLLDANNRSAWVHRRAGGFLEREPSTRAEIQSVIAFQPPRIRISADDLSTDAETIRLRGTISDDHHLRDFHIHVFSSQSDERLQAAKRVYRYVGAESVSVDEELELYPGSNRIIIWARDNDKTISIQTLYVYRHTDEAAASRR